jgi:hypothetical protein
MCREVDMRDGLPTLGLFVLAGCGDNNAASIVVMPGQETSVETQGLEVGAQLLQGAPPIQAMNAYLDGFQRKLGIDRDST